MEKIAVIWSMLLMMMMAALPLAHCSIDQSPKAVEKWFKDLPNAKEKLTKLHFYFHDNVTAKNPTAIQVARANITTNTSSPIDFGAIFVIDDPLTTGPELNSKIIGRAQGIFSSASQGEFAFLMALNLVFTDGKYKGSTLSLLGNNQILRQYREMPIVGGSGVFRLARGIATAQTYTFNTTTLNAIVEYNVFVIHY